MPLPISASNMELGPTNGLTVAPFLLRQVHQHLPGIGNAGAARLADDADVFSLFEFLLKSSRNLRGNFLHVVPLVRIDHYLLPEQLQVAPGRPFILYKKHGAFLHGIEDVGR